MEGVKGRETPMGFVQVNSTNQIQKSKQQALLQNKTKWRKTKNCMSNRN